MSAAADLSHEQARAMAADDLRTLAWLHAAERDAATWLALGEAGFPGGLTLLGERSEVAVPMMATALQQLGGEVAHDARAANDRLAADYAAIYLTHALRASPCESVWLDEDHLMLQAPTFAVRERYREHGLAVAADRARALPDDHLANELAFCAHLLVQGEMQALAAFLDAHLLRWLPEFAARVVRRAETGVYAGLAAATEEAVLRLRSALVGEGAPAGEPFQ